MSIQSFCVLVLCIASASAAAVKKCHFEQLDACGAPLNDLRKEMGQKFPTNEAQVNRLCEELDKANGCLTRFKDSCMTPMQLEIMGFVTEGAYDVYNEFCTAGSEVRTNYLKHAECMNKAHETDEYKELSSYVEAGMEEMQEKPKTEQLPASCCAYHWMDQESRKFGTEKCGKEAVDAFQKVANMAASNLPDVLCSGFDPYSPQCTSVLPPPGTKPKGTLKNSQIAKSFAELYL